MTCRGGRFNLNIRNARLAAVSANASIRAILLLALTVSVPRISLSPLINT